LKYLKWWDYLIDYGKYKKITEKKREDEPSHDKDFDTHAHDYNSPHGQKNKVGVLASSI
jgi:hypothetical protein